MKQLRIGFSTGYLENYWGDWFSSAQIGGSEHLLVEVACELAAQGHSVAVRLPYESGEFVHRGVNWFPQSAKSRQYDLLFCFDDFERRDNATRVNLVACRSDPPRRDHFDSLIFLSRHHAELMGHPDSPAVGGGVDLAAYRSALRRVRGMVICTSSPDRCRAAFEIGRYFRDFVFTYRPVPGLPPTRELTRPRLVRLQMQAQVLIYPLDPVRPSDFFSMAVLEAMAAGTPVVLSDADSMPELWAAAAVMLPRPIRVSQWVDTVEGLLANKARWQRHAAAGRALAARYDWSAVARRYLEAAGA